MTAQAGRQLIDVHGHFVTDHYVAAAKAAGHLRPDGMPGWPSRDTATRVGLMDTGGVATAMLSVSSPGTHFGDHQAARSLTRHVNDAGTRDRSPLPGPLRPLRLPPAARRRWRAGRGCPRAGTTWAATGWQSRQTPTASISAIPGTSRRGQNSTGGAPSS